MKSAKNYWICFDSLESEENTKKFDWKYTLPPNSRLISFDDTASHNNHWKHLRYTQSLSHTPPPHASPHDAKEFMLPEVWLTVNIC